MIQVYTNKEDCSGCTACFSICPVKAIKMETDDKGFQYPLIDQKKCIDCGRCKNICAFHETTAEPTEYPYVYAMKHKNEDIRRQSSSGGVFYELAAYVISMGGVVYGAAYDQELAVIHKAAYTLEECLAFRGSKYVASDLKQCFCEIKELLTAGKTVLFSGTPCQTAGLKSFIESKYADQLILVDLVCHGTPSPKIWSDYRKYVQKKFNSVIESVNFRDKSNGWHIFSISMKLNHTSYICDKNHDPYFKLFLHNFIHRPSCHQCKFTNYNRPSDLTIGDFWGIEAYKPKFDDNKGVSLLLINTQRGKIIFNQIKNQFNVEKSNTKECLQGVFKSPVVKNKKSNDFWKDYQQYDFSFLIEKYGKVSITEIFKVHIMIPFIRKVGLYNVAINIVRIIERRKIKK